MPFLAPRKIIPIKRPPGIKIINLLGALSLIPNPGPTSGKKTNIVKSVSEHPGNRRINFNNEKTAVFSDRQWANWPRSRASSIQTCSEQESKKTTWCADHPPNRFSFSEILFTRKCTSRTKIQHGIDRPLWVSITYA